MNAIAPDPLPRPRNGRLARAVSVLTFPPLVALAAFLLLDAFRVAPTLRGSIALITLLLGVAWPIAATGFVLRRRSAPGIEGPSERLLLLGIAAVGYGIGTGLLVLRGAPLLVTLLMLCYATNSSVMLAVNATWKASVHAMGIAGPTTALLFAFGSLGLLLGLLLPLTGWSRVRLGAHTVAQFVAGAALGFLLTGAQMLLGLRLF